MLIGVEAHSVRVDGHVGEINASILGTLDRTAVGAATDLAVLHRAANVNNVRSAWRRVDRHVVRALRCAVAERGETRSSVRIAGQRGPAAVRPTGEERRSWHVRVIDATEGGTGSRHTAVGFGALQNCTAPPDFAGNTAVGAGALRDDTTGNFNTAIGDSALKLNTEGDVNTAIGLDALVSNTTGDSNTATGGNALFNNTEGFQNTATVGVRAP